jgi:hypothetical protein
MALERRKTSGAYMYLSRRDPATGRVRKVYLGRGPEADAAAEALATRRKQREADRRALEACRSELEAVDGLMSELVASATVLREAALLIEGYQRVNYGPWRKRRTGAGDGGRRAGMTVAETTPRNGGTTMATDGDREESAQDVLTRVKEWYERAKGGNVALLKGLRSLLESHPDFVQRYGDLARRAERAWIALAAGNDPYFQETIAHSAEAQRAELTRPGASPIEKLLVERVVACGMQVNYFSTTEANALNDGETPKQLQFRAKRLAQAQKMYLAALGALATFQKLTPVPTGAQTPVESTLPARLEDRTSGTSCVWFADASVESESHSDGASQEERERARVRITN